MLDFAVLMLEVDELATMIDHSIVDPNRFEVGMHAGTDVTLRCRTGRFTTQALRMKASELAQPVAKHGVFAGGRHVPA